MFLLNSTPVLFAIITSNKGSIVTQRSLHFIVTEPLFYPNAGSVLFSPRGKSIYPACGAYISSVVDIYIQHSEYIYPPRWIYISTSEPKKLKVLKALPLAYSTLLLQGIIFPVSAAITFQQSVFLHHFTEYNTCPSQFYYQIVKVNLKYD